VTLVETTIATVIVATMIVMLLNTFGSLARGQQLTASRYSASCLAAHLMSEILQNLYQDPNNPVFGPETGEAGTSRANFDDVDDYNGWTESPPQRSDGTPISGLAGWRRSVTVEYIDPNTMAAGAQDLGVKRITVVVADPRGRSVSVVSLRSSNGTYDQSPFSQTTCVRWIGVELQVGSDSSSRVYSGTNLFNIIPG